MGFTTPTFFFVFLPVCVGLYLLTEALERRGAAVLSRLRVRDLLLIAVSLGFYGWTFYNGIYRFLLYMLLVWAAGKAIGRWRSDVLQLPVVHGEGDSARLQTLRLPLGGGICLAAVAAAVAWLFYNKYLNFSIGIVNGLLATHLEPRSILVPLGVSFITFSAISYLVDIYRGKAPAGSLIDCLLYLSFFPKVVSGPIVLWKDFSAQMHTRRTSESLAVAGVNRICTGFVKKVLLADMFGMYVAKIDGLAAGGIDPVTAWGAVVFYMLQIYYDFAGYSDIAIGISNLLGFDFAANFRFPYRSCSISEFWRRWHISLGSWFREYVYFPLGGSRRGLHRTLINLGVVFALTGIWHGASWNYILWGGINAAFVLTERVAQDRPLYQKIPKGVKWAFTMLVAMLFWQLFRFPTLGECAHWFRLMLGQVEFDRIEATWQFLFDRRIVFLTVSGILGATVLGSPRLQETYRRWSATALGYGLQELVLLALLAASVVAMINSTYSPFIYFQY